MEDSRRGGISVLIQPDLPAFLGKSQEELDTGESAD